MNIYSYFSSTQNTIISKRTKAGLDAAKKAGKLLGRPIGSKAKTRILDPYNNKILELLEMNISQSSILKIINNKLQKPISMTSLRYHIEHHQNLKNAKDKFKRKWIK
jgi:DNA invertase Pin-like site-specific DNA recombinase